MPSLADAMLVVRIVLRRKLGASTWWKYPKDGCAVPQPQVQYVSLVRSTTPRTLRCRLAWYAILVSPSLFPLLFLPLLNLLSK